MKQQESRKPHKTTSTQILCRYRTLRKFIVFSQKYLARATPYSQSAICHSHYKAESVLRYLE